MTYEEFCNQINEDHWVDDDGTERSLLTFSEGISCRHASGLVERYGREELEEQDRRSLYHLLCSEFRDALIDYGTETFFAMAFFEVITSAYGSGDSVNALMWYMDDPSSIGEDGMVSLDGWMRAELLWSVLQADPSMVLLCLVLSEMFGDGVASVGNVEDCASFLYDMLRSTCYKERNEDGSWVVSDAELLEQAIPYLRGR